MTSSEYGAAGYLDCLQQELFKTKDIRAAVSERHKSNLEPHLKDLFDKLKKGTAQTNEIMCKLGIDRVFEQRDAAEYLEKILTRTSPFASQIFHGELTHTTICGKCEAKNSTHSRVWHLPLALTDSYSKAYHVVDGIKEYFRDLDFSGQDQMYCDRCDHKVDATIRCEVKRHPEVLVLLLKRFEFDYRYMRYVKNNRVATLPFTLQIPEQSSRGKESETSRDQSETYELYAAVDHVGDLGGGHYAALIKSQDDEQWYNFNDASVTQLKYKHFQLDTTQISREAYLLFYRKLPSERQNGLQRYPHQAHCEYHGLVNHGATCYLNSVLQVLFMTKGFRAAVERPNSDLEQHLEILLDHLRRQTIAVMNILGIDAVDEQHEAAENLDKVSVQTSPETLQMHGPLTRTTICCKCPTSTDSQIWHIPLALTDSHVGEYRVEDGIEAYFRDSHLNRQDQMYCGQCGDKADVLTGCEAKHQPKFLVLLLKRFEFDYSHLTYVKNSREVEFSHALKIPENQTYELDAAVEHVGDLKDGHFAKLPKHHYNTKSTSACLLFYKRQEHTSSQDIREVSTGGGFLPTTSETTETVRQRKEAEEDGHVDNDTKENVSPDKHEDQEIRDRIHAEPRGAELVVPEPKASYVENQDSEGFVRQRKEAEENGHVDNDTKENVSPDKHEDEGIRIRIHAEPRRAEPVVPEPKASYVENQDSEGFVRQTDPHGETDEDKSIGHEGENVKRNEPDDQIEKREAVPTETDRAVDQKAENAAHRKRDLSPEVSYRQRTHGPLHEQNETSRDQSRVMDVRTETDKRAVGDEQSGNLHRNTEHQVSKGTHDVRLKLNIAQTGKLEIRSHISPVGEQHTDFQGIREGKSRYSELGEMKKVKGKERGDDSHALRRELPKTHEPEGADYQHKTILAHGNIKCICTECRGEEEIIKVYVKKGKKREDEEGAGVTPKIKSDKCQKENNDTTRNSNPRRFEHGEKTSEFQNEDEDTERRRTSDRHKGGGLEDHRNQQQQENKHKDLGNQNKGDEKKRENVDNVRGRSAGNIEKETQKHVRGTREWNKISVEPSNDKHMPNKSQAQTDKAEMKHRSEQRAEKKRKWWQKTNNSKIKPEPEGADYQHNSKSDDGTCESLVGTEEKRQRLQKEETTCCFGSFRFHKNPKKQKKRGKQ